MRTFHDNRFSQQANILEDTHPVEYLTIQK